MKLLEYQTKKIFQENGIPIPKGFVCSTEEAVLDAFDQAGQGGEAVLNAQVRVDERVTTGGIKIAGARDEALERFKELRRAKIKGLSVSEVLVEERIRIRNAYYVGVTIDPTHSKPIVSIGYKGGGEVESVAGETSVEMVQQLIDPRYGISSHKVIKAMEALGIVKDLFPKILDHTKRLYEIFTHYEATLVEIDPLIESDDHALIAGNARLNVDDNAVFKHEHLVALSREFSESQESELRRNGVYFVNVGGNIGLVCVGAGMSMATMDLVAAAGGKPACFCDISAGINPKSMELALNAVSNLAGVKSVLLNMFGGITRMDEVARSFIAAWNNMGGISQPVVIRLEGTNVEEGRKIIRDQGFDTDTNLYEAVDKAVQLGS